MKKVISLLCALIVLDAVKIDTGYMYVSIPELSPFAQRLADPNDDMVKRVYLNVQFEFLTSY